MFLLGVEGHLYKFATGYNGITAGDLVSSNILQHFTPSAKLHMSKVYFLLYKIQLEF